ncbi:hypothetical protein FB45DRAFT_1063485 [Roridomyces roridus]|uniref:Uncharacterized protein n=1 Tax=Roridomyces roridus TaxID=1738132 RepID=A0AAD7BDX4_9AGAR|nr:hypothetical protein FB45DRAFT_1063485 [Roridomyces roridus]
MNGTYTFLQRMLLYALLLFGVIGLFTASNWMTGPFLGAAMAYAGAGAIHAIILAVSSHRADQRGTIDLDSLPIFQILAVCVYLYPPLFMCSYSLRRRTGYMHSTVVIVCAWGILIASGFICTMTTKPSTIPPCALANITLSDGSIRSVAPDIGACASFCSTKSSIHRTAGQAQIQSSTITVSHVFRGLSVLGIVMGISCTIFMMVALILAVAALFSESPLDLLIVMREVVRDAGRIARQRHKRRDSPAVMLYLIVVAVVGGPIALIVQVFQGENYLRKARLAQETVTAVGQWGPWVTVALASIAAVFFVLMSSIGKETVPSDQASMRDGEEEEGTS